MIVGPNNAGKSRFLKEIAGLATKQHTDGLLVRDVESSMPVNLEELRKSYDVERHQERSGSWAWGGLDTNLCQKFHVSGGIGGWPQAYEQQFPKGAIPKCRYAAVRLECFFVDGCVDISSPSSSAFNSARHAGGSQRHSVFRSLAIASRV